MIQLLPGIRIKVPNRHSTYGRVKLKTIQLFLGKYMSLEQPVITAPTNAKAAIQRYFFIAFLILESYSSTVSFQL